MKTITTAPSVYGAAFTEVMDCGILIGHVRDIGTGFQANPMRGKSALFEAKDAAIKYVAAAGALLVSAPAPKSYIAPQKSLF